MIKEELTAALVLAVEAAGMPAASVVLDHPGDSKNGDYATSIALALAKAAGEKPLSVAERIVKELEKAPHPAIENISIAGVGFINFYLTDSFFAENVKTILSTKEQWGRSDDLAGQKILVEYTQPNPFKPFHIGHLMSNTIGESLSRLVEFSGAELFRANYQGDIGPHVAKCLWALQKEGLDPNSIEDLGTAYVAGSAAYEEDAAAKSEIDDINRRLYAGDAELAPLYDAGKKASLDHFEALYQLLGTKFDHYFFESETAKVGEKIVRDVLSRGVFEESNGAIVFRGEQHGLHTRVFITSAGTPTYEAKEIGLVQAKRELFPFDLNITTVAVEQDGYFKVIEAVVAQLWPELANKYIHVSHGMLQLTGGKMSSRKGNVITGESLIEDMRAKARDKMEGRDLGDEHESVVNVVAVSAIKYGVLKQATGKNIIFDPEKSLSFEGDSGPYLQYSYTRAHSVLSKAREEGVVSAVDASAPATIVEKLLYRFPEMVRRSREERQPHHILHYLTELAGVFNSWYAQEKILDGSPNASHKLAITEATATTIKNGLWLLGIEAPERM